MLIIKEIDLFGLLSLSYQYSCWVVHRFVIPLLILFLLLNFSLFPFLCYGTIPIITFFVQRAIYTSLPLSIQSQLLFLFQYISSYKDIYTCWRFTFNFSCRIDINRKLSYNFSLLLLLFSCVHTDL